MQMFKDKSLIQHSNIKLVLIFRYTSHLLMTSLSWEGGHSGPFQWVTRHVLEIKKIYQRIVNNVNLSVLNLEKRYLHQNGVEFDHTLIGNQFRGISRQNPNKIQQN